jgi:hypothetical protein
MAYSKAKLKSSGDKASSCFSPFWIGKLSDKCLPIQTFHLFHMGFPATAEFFFVYAFNCFHDSSL